MSWDVSSWFVDQLRKRSSKPKRRLTLAGSDYSARVHKWPRLRRSADRVQSSKISINLANTDGGLNRYYENTFHMPGSCTIEFGYTHPDSGDELIPLFTGEIHVVSYTEKFCKLPLRDRMWDFTSRVVGDSDNPVTFTSVLVSDIAWTLCTCYGGLSSVESDANPDIDYDSFLDFAAVFSADTVLCSARYEGEKVTEALEKLAKYTDSAIWVEGDGKLYFRRFSEPDSLDFVVVRNDQVALQIDIDGMQMVNRLYVDWNYSTDSDYWQDAVISVDSTSVNTFGLHEDRLQDETIWYVDSASALNMAQRKTSLLKAPPRRFMVSTGVIGLHRQLGETVRLVDSFYGITSDSGWRFTEMDIALDTGRVGYLLDEAATMNAFYLDVSYLDGNDCLL